MSRTRNALVFSVSSLLVGAALLAGCDDTTGTGGAGGATSSSTGTGTSTTGSTTNASSSGQTSSASGSTSSASGSSGSTTSSSSSGSSSSSASSSSGGAMMLNGCTEATAEDHTNEGTVKINFGGALGSIYSPPCIKVAAGAQVSFNGDFTFHPLRGGTVVNGVTTLDPNSPITSTDTGMAATFTMATVGDFGFYCNFHAIFGMAGAIFVQ